MRTVGIAILANLDFALPHAHTVATLLPQNQVKSRYFAFLCVRMTDAQKVVFSEGKCLL
jgi:hypothetical protein